MTRPGLQPCATQLGADNLKHFLTILKIILNFTTMWQLNDINSFVSILELEFFALLWNAICPRAGIYSLRLPCPIRFILCLNLSKI